MINGYWSRSNVPAEVVHRLRLLGANGADLTRQEPTYAGVAVTRTGEGAYRATFTDNPGNFVGWFFGFGAATPADLKGYTAVRDTWDATNKRLDFVVYDSTFTAADLIADQYIDIHMVFSDTAV